jgi:DeoR family transcriptional regulator, glycerol-3-phosphate regulon repressor
MSLKTQTDILHAVRETGSCSIADLASRLAVSTETIRRNVKPLIDGGAVLRFHGGVMIPDRREEAPFQRRMQLNRSAKRIAAGLVRDRVRDGDSLILDNGATSAYVAEALSVRSNLIIVTNSAEIAWRLASRNGNRVFMAGGELGSDDAAAFGAAAIAFIRQFQVRYAVISVAGIAARGDLVDFHLFEAEFSRAAMEQADEVWIVADQSKFGRDAPVRICDLSAVDLVVSDAKPGADFLRLLEEANVRLVIPEAASRK